MLRINKTAHFVRTAFSHKKMQKMPSCHGVVTKKYVFFPFIRSLGPMGDVTSVFSREISDKEKKHNHLLYFES